MSRNLSRAALCLTLISAALVFSAAAKAQFSDGVFEGAPRDWRIYDSENFTLYTDVGLPDAERMLSELEDFRQFIRHELKPVGGVRPRLTILAPSRAADFGAFADQNSRSGVFFRTVDTDFMLINLSHTPDFRTQTNGAPTIKEILQHEYVHAVVNDLPGKPVPLWLNEGFAEYYATAERDGDHFVVGRPVKRRLDDLSTERSVRRGPRYGRLSTSGFRRTVSGPPPIELAPLDDIIRANEQSKVYVNALDQTNYHAQSWLIIHNILSRPDGRAVLYRYLNSRRDRDDNVKALRAALGVNLSKFDTALWNQVRDRDFPERRVPAPSPPSTTVRTLGTVSKADLWCQVGRFRGFRAGNEAAKSVFERVLRMDPNNVCALSHLSKLESWDFDLVKAEGLVARAEAADGSDPFTPLARAMLIYNEVRSVDDPEILADPALYEAGVTWAERTIAMEPGMALPHFIRASLAYRNPKATVQTLQTGLDSALEAERLWPQNPTLRLLTATLFMRLSDFPAAQERLKFVRDWAPNPSLRRNAESLLSDLETALTD